MIDKNKNDNNEEYSAAGFSDIISSPIFLVVLILTFILGLSSVFGFFQNPRKLKAIIDLISQRVFISDVQQKPQFPHIVNNNIDSILPWQLKAIYKRDGYVTASSLNEERYSIFSKEFKRVETASKSIDSTLVVRLNYDITSQEFWGDLNIGLGLAKKSLNLAYVADTNKIIGVPMSPYYSLGNERLKYSLVAMASES